MLRAAYLLAAVPLLALAQPPLQPFPMPWNDASPGITNLQHWQSPIALDSARLLVNPETGHYERDGARVRILGVNVTATQAFPSAENAEAHAARLARFGYNGVRFHHLEAPWEKSRVLVDYSQGNSRTLSPERLDRLHYFIAVLASRGLFINMNLLVSREFQRGDGLGDEIAAMGWKDQHILAFFNETALELHKEYARNLLLAPNPYRDGKPLAEDPALAMVEIMNENGLLQKWHEGVLDRMPSVYREQLQARWNDWLAARYESTAAMLQAWGAINEPIGPSMLRNGDFASGSSSWNIERHSGAAASVTYPRDFNNGDASLRVEVTTPGQANWHVQVNQAGLRLETGKVYTISFWAKAATPNTPLSASIMRAYGDYRGLSSGPSVTLQPDWREYTWVFQSDLDEPNARVNFNGFGNLRAIVSIANVRVNPGGRIGGVPEDRSLETRNVPAVAKVSATLAPTAPQRLDWIRFAQAAEFAYWTEMRRFIKEDLGYPGIVFGTIIANSGPNTQASLDAMDSHAYWQHPSFPAGQDWDPVEWTVNNVSMLTASDGGTIPGIARQRVKGRPHNVTEYQHPAPMTYSSESPILIAAYGALQDWDSLWFFEYGTSRSEFVSGFFDQSAHSGKLVNNLIAATLFRRSDVAPAEQEFSFAFSPDREATVAATRGGAWGVSDGSHIGIPASLALVSRVALNIGVDAEGLETAPPAITDPVLRSDHGQLAWDRSIPARGVFTANTPRTKSVVGFSDAKTFDLDGVRIEVGSTRQGWSAISLTLMEGESFTSSTAQRILIATTGDQENTGMVWKNPATRNSVGNRWGTAPVVVEAPAALITLPVSAGRVTGWALDATGQRGAQLPVESGIDGRANLRLGTEATLWYEIEVAPESDQLN